jgi:hypothetical protein
MSGHDVSAAPAICAMSRLAKRMAWDFKDDFFRKKDGVGIINIEFSTSANGDGL